MEANFAGTLVGNIFRSLGRILGGPIPGDPRWDLKSEGLLGVSMGTQYSLDP